jgi:cell division septation protein DedD
MKPHVHAAEASSVSPGFVKEFSARKNVQQKTNLPSSPAKGAKNGKYAIQIIAYPEARIKDALAFAHDLRKTQSDVYLERVNIRKQGVWYRILMGHFKNAEDATRYMKEQKILEAYPGSFVQLKSEG